MHLNACGDLTWMDGLPDCTMICREISVRGRAMLFGMAQNLPFPLLLRVRRMHVVINAPEHSACRDPQPP